MTAPALPDMTRLIAFINEAGYGGDIRWSEELRPPSCPRAFAREAIYVICNSGMRFKVAQQIYTRVMAAIEDGRSAGDVFGHVGKALAIDDIWAKRDALLNDYLAADDKVAWCETLPWVGGITKWHLAKNFGADVAKPDVHLLRLAALYETTAQELCERIAQSIGLRVATVDTLLWRAAAIGVLDTRTGALHPPAKPYDLFDQKH